MLVLLTLMFRKKAVCFHVSTEALSSQEWSKLSLHLVSHYCLSPFIRILTDDFHILLKIQQP